MNKRGKMVGRNIVNKKKSKNMVSSLFTGSAFRALAKSKSVNKKTLNVSATGSAFRALASNNQSILSLSRTKIQFANEQFDINNEYTPSSSTFVPKQTGIYSIDSSVVFSPAITNQLTSISMSVLVNNAVVATTLKNFVPTAAFSVEVSAILRLRSGDRVEIIFTANREGQIFLSDLGSQVSTAFQAARF
ncbi:C1q-like domain-containing protein [Paenibacillus illinoisensis]|uniref:C1q domain-containing protein n=1 Tax=Paenibacillus illinoisensis TaxID=59845 RepID=A0A2W0C1Y6_9BACL|nr:ABC transporter permease [Paenibacillus illinoisensis]PYY25906.1 Uncharacterized protein PIL02S_05275 [Paenibacillus illinoisensis]